MASRRVMARAALRELLDSIYFFWSQMKAAQAVITPKPMPKAKASITDRGFQGLPKAFRDPSFKDKTRIRAEDHGLGVSKTMKPNAAPVVNINIFGSGSSWSSGAWTCIILCFFPGVSVLQMLVLVLFFLEPCRWPAPSATVAASRRCCYPRAHPSGIERHRR